MFSTRRLLALAVAFLTLLVVIDVTSHEERRPSPTVTKTLAGPQPGKQTITVPTEAIDEAKASDVGHHDDLRDELPANVPLKDLTAAAQQQDDLAANDGLPVVTPLAAPEQRGCTSRFVRNYSSRRGVRPRLWVLHYTVSPNRPGWSDVNSIVSLFDTASFQASSNYVVDNEGHCAYIVRESDKAWTQATANPVSISVEVINTGKESTYAASAGLARLAQVISDSAKRWDIPIRRGKVSGCVVATSGILAHTDLGACGGGHADINPFSVDQVIAAVLKYRRAGQVTEIDRVTCRKLNWWRANDRPKGQAEANAVRRRRALDSRSVDCTSKGPVKR